MDLGYYRTETAFELCSPANVVIWLFHPGDVTGHVGCDTEYGVSLGSNMGLGYL